MTNGPLPPHERSWRHPSELAAAPLEPPTRSGRLLIASTATVSLLLVGVLMFVVTPGRSDAPAARLDSTLVAVGAVEAVTAGGSAIATTIAGTIASAAGAAPSASAESAPSATSATSRAQEAQSAPAAGAPSESAFASASGSPATAAARATSTVAPPTDAAPPIERRAPAAMMLVTPIGEGLAVTTQAAMGSLAAVVDDEVAPMAAALPSGESVEVDVVASDGDLVVVSIRSGATPEDRTLADEHDTLDGDSTFVVVDGTTARFDAAIYPPPHLPEAAPVVDHEGRLLALCTIGPSGIELVTVSALPTVPAATAAESSPVPSEPAPAESRPESAPPPTTAATPASDPATTTTTSATTTTVAGLAPATSVP